MSNFRVGMRVSCIKDSVIKVNDLGLPGFLKGKVFTIVGITHHAVYGMFLIFSERDPRNLGHVDGFRPLVERKTDISQFKAMLNKTTTKVQA